MTVQLHHGDCLNVMPNIPNGSVDMILADPPYGTTACKWDSVIPLDMMWKELKRVIKPNGAIVMTASQPFTTTLISSNIKQFKYSWVWKKNAGSNFGSVKYQPMKEHEDVVVFGKGRVNYYPIKQERSESGKKMIAAAIESKPTSGTVYGEAGSKGYNNGKANKQLRCPSSVQLFNRERGFHPTQKPVKLMEYLVKTYTNESETVLDFAMGSGTTGVACQNLNRNFIGIELDAEYFRIAQDRLNTKE